MRGLSVGPAAAGVLAAMAAVQAVRAALPAWHDMQLLRLLAFAPFRDGALEPLLLYGAFTSVLVHAGWGHLLMNGLCAAALSSQLRPHVGGVRYVALFMASGAAGALVHGALNWGSPAALVGASGAVFGLFGAGAHVLLRADDGRGRPRLRHHLRYALVIMAVNLGYASLGGGLVSWEAHAGGFFAGLALYPLLRPRRGGA